MVHTQLLTSHEPRLMSRQLSGVHMYQEKTTIELVYSTPRKEAKEGKATPQADRLHKLKEV